MARTSKRNSPSSTSGACQGLGQPSHMNSGSSGSVGSTGSGGSSTSFSSSRHSKSSSSGGVTSSVPVKVKAEVASVSWSGPVRYSVSGGSRSGGGKGPSNSKAPLSQRPFSG